MTLDSKTKLTQFCQKFIGRVLNKKDVEFSVGRLPTGKIQGTVTLNCMPEAPAYAGEPQTTRQAAEESAASEALVVHSADIAKLEANKEVLNPTKGAKRKKDDEGPVSSVTRAAKKLHTAESFTYKQALFETCSKVCKRTCNKTMDVIFTTEQEGDQACNKMYTTTVRLPCLANKCSGIGEEVFVGETFKSVKDADQSAAYKAFMALCEVDDREVRMALNKIKEKQATFEEHMNELSARRERGEELYSYDEMLEWFQNNKDGADPESGEAESRQPLSDEQVTGKVKFVRREYGIITPTVAVAHPLAPKSGGDVWFDMKDVVGVTGSSVPAWLVAGVDVSFHVYADSQSLGAEEVMAS